MRKLFCLLTLVSAAIIFTGCGQTNEQEKKTKQRATAEYATLENDLTKNRPTTDWSLEEIDAYLKKCDRILDLSKTVDGAVAKITYFQLLKVQAEYVRSTITTNEALNGVSRRSDMVLMSAELGRHDAKISELESDITDLDISLWDVEYLERKLEAVSELLKQNSELAKKVENKRLSLGHETQTMISRLETHRERCDKIVQKIKTELMLREVQAKSPTTT